MGQTPTETIKNYYKPLIRFIEESIKTIMENFQILNPICKKYWTNLTLQILLYIQ